MLGEFLTRRPYNAAADVIDGTRLLNSGARGHVEREKGCILPRGLQLTSKIKGRLR